MIKLVIVEDDSFLLNTLHLILQIEQDIEVIGLFSNPESAFKRYTLT
ncbi:MAG: response regulator transcription factor [Saprospiraceae bacterium]|nr:response regulator transcription factor [Saprospiraceae bacterium]